MNLSTRDRRLIWHPFTQEQTASIPIAVKRGFGAYLYDENDKAYLDLISSWWVNLHGHSNEFIANAIYQQAQKLEHVIFAGFTHEPAVTLCEKLQALLPKKLGRFFFSDNGSTAVEAALKMAYQYWYNKGETQRTVFLSLAGGYHGDTFGAMSVGASSGFHDPFQSLFFSTETIPYPYTWQGDESALLKEEQALAELEEKLHFKGNNIAALILEPLMQGASGMRMCSANFIEKVVGLARSYGVLVIFDEVMTGFYRTGKLFAFEHTKVVPDFLCLSKGLTGGFLPLALTITSEEVYEAFLSPHFSKAFAHGHSYTANPLGCAAAIASLELLMSDNTIEAIKTINKAHQVGMENLRVLPRVQKLRTIGTIAAFDLEFPLEKIKEIKEQLLQEGLLIRPLGKSVYLLPPYCTSYNELIRTYEILQSFID